MEIKFSKTGLPVKSLAQLEAEIHGEIPEDIRLFLMKNNGATPEPNQFYHSASDSVGINQFLSLKEILEEKKCLKDRVPNEAWPIAYAEGGNLVCLVLGKKQGIYFWDHELESEEGVAPNWDNMLLLCSTFTELLTGLKRIDPDEIELQPDQVMSVWVDPDFKPEF